MGFVRWLGEENCHDPLKVGPKAANCSRLKEKFNVPPGFCIPDVEAKARHIDREQIILTGALKNEIAESYHKLGEILGVKTPTVAVRSSAIDEDKPNASFAGQHDTLLNIVGEEMLFDAIIKCWASAEHECVKEYRKKHNLSLEHIHIAVLIQACILSDVSAVAFSIDPISKNKNQIIINANFGLGKSIADGNVDPDHFVVDKTNTKNILRMDLHKKEIMTVATDRGTQDVKVPSFLQTKATLSHEKLTEISNMIIKLEEFMGVPVDIELAYQNDILYLLQCRPITSHTVG